MFNLLEKFNQKQMNSLIQGKELVDVRPGDQIAVGTKIFENGKFERVQTFKGLCIAKKNNGLHSSITVRRIGGQKGDGVEYILPLYSTVIDNIEILQRGRVRRAKLYYIRNLYGRAAKMAVKRVKKSM